MVIWPIQRPDIFSGLRAAPKGLLLFGPPGTGKTMIGRAIATESGATFFAVSASTLTSKWMGEGEKLVRAMFAVARVEQPSVVFIDEIDSLLTQRSGDENEATRRIKTEFLVQWDGAASSKEDRLLIVGATNRPQELDEAARRRLVKRIYIPLPDEDARRSLLDTLLPADGETTVALSDDDRASVVAQSAGYSGSDLHYLCQEASMGPIRRIQQSTEPVKIVDLDVSTVPPVELRDFSSAFRQVRASVSANDLSVLVEWDRSFGSAPAGT